MQLKTMIGLLWLSVLLTLLSSCKLKIDTYKEAYVGDFENNQIINGNGDTVSSSSPEFNNYVCGHYRVIGDIKAYLKKLERKRR